MDWAELFSCGVFTLATLLACSFHHSLSPNSCGNGQDRCFPKWDSIRAYCFFFLWPLHQNKFVYSHSVNETGPRSRACGRMNILQTGWSSDDLWKTRHISVVIYWFRRFVEIVCWTQTLAMERESWGNLRMNKSTFEKMALSRHCE